MVQGKEQNSFQKHIFSLIEKEQGHINKVVIPTVLLSFCGDLETATFLSQLMYWCDKGKSPDGYIFKSCREWYQETGLSEYYVGKSADKLKSQGLLETKKKRANGHPTIHYRLNKKDFANELIKYLRNDSEKIKNRNPKISECKTDITPEHTAKHTTEITEKEYGVNSNELHTVPIPFKKFKKTTNLGLDTIDIIEDFLEQYQRCRGEEHPNLKTQQWERVVATLFFCYDDKLDGKRYELDVEDLVLMIDRYFETEFQPGCNYSIIHFNDNEIKLRRMYEVGRY
jgi:hypothetical protein